MQCSTHIPPLSIHHSPAFHDDVLGQALSLIELTTISGRVAVHAATALKAGFTSIVTTDNDFASVPGLRPITPESALAP